MKAFKRDNFERANPSVEFPTVTPVGREVAGRLRARLRDRLGIGPADDGLAMVQAVAGKSKQLDSTSALAANFDLGASLSRLGIRALPTVFVNWYRFDDIDAIDLRSLVERFRDLWYPGSDDVEIFDETCDWIITVQHTGDVGFLTLRM